MGFFVYRYPSPASLGFNQFLKKTDWNNSCFVVVILFVPMVYISSQVMLQLRIEDQERSHDYNI